MTKIIADLCGNHCGNLGIMESMIRVLGEHKIDIVKLQSWKADNLIRDREKNYQYYKDIELDDNAHYLARNLCERYNIELLCTCFDIGRIKFLKSLGLKKVKVASPDFMSFKMIDLLLEDFDEVIISTAAATENEFDEFIKRYFEGIGFEKITLMHCNPIYPCPLDKTNMRMLNSMEFNWASGQFGFSDHTLGIVAGQLAISLGVKYLEKHFTLNQNLPGRDQFFSGTIKDFIELREYRDAVEKMMDYDGFLPETEIEKEYREKYIGRWGDNK